MKTGTLSGIVRRVVIATFCSGLAVTLGFGTAAWAQRQLLPPSEAGRINGRVPFDEAPAPMLLRVKQENPRAAALIPVVMHTMARGLQRNGAAPQSDLDRIFDEVMRRHPGASREMLKQMVDGYNAIPESSRNGGATGSLQRLDIAKPLQISDVRRGTGSLLRLKGSPNITASDLTKAIDPRLADQLAAQQGIDPEPEIKSITVGSNYESGAILSVRGNSFKRDKDLTVFVLSQRVNNVWVAIGEVKADKISSQTATIYLPGKFNGPGFPVVPDTAPPVEYRIHAVRKAAANPNSKKDTQSPDVAFTVPHLMKANAAAILANPDIVSQSSSAVYAGEQVLDLKVSNLGWTRVLQQGMFNNKPVLTDKYYNVPATNVSAVLVSQSNDGYSYGPAEGVTCKVISPSGANGSPAQVQVRFPYGVYPGAYTIQLRTNSGLPYPSTGGTVAWGNPSTPLIFSDATDLNIKPFRYTGIVNKLEYHLKENKSYDGKHNFNTFCIFTVVANGEAFYSQTGVRKLLLGTPEPWGFGNEGLTLKNADGSPVDLYTPVGVIVSVYNYTPGSDNQGDINKIVEGTKVAGDLAALIGTAVGGPEVGQAIATYAPMVVELVEFVANLFHKVTAPSIYLRSQGSTVIDYADWVKSSSGAAKQYTGTNTFSAGLSEQYGGVWEFNTSFSWRRGILQ